MTAPPSETRPLHAAPLPQLDGLRALAVAGVMVTHFFYERPGVRALRLGSYGVSLFFVLSGFLITGILLDAREHAARAEAGRLHLLRQFYARRFLRIFPLYYFVLALTAAIGVTAFRDTWPWHVAYASNFYFAHRGSWLAPVTPYWSLALEEQFYLAWPWVVLFVPPRRLFAVVLAGVIACPLARLAMYLSGRVDPFAIGVLPTGSADLLFAGALLAVTARDPAPARMRRVVCIAGLWFGVPTLALVRVTEALGWPGQTARGVLEVTALAGVFTWVVDRGARGFEGAIGRGLSWAPVAYVGRISYGLYVWHALLSYVSYGVFARVGLHLAPGSLVRAALLTAVSLGVASLSWVVLERPLNELKRHFPYVPHPAQAHRVDVLRAAPGRGMHRS